MNVAILKHKIHKMEIITEDFGNHETADQNMKENILKYNLLVRCSLFLI